MLTDDTTFWRRGFPMANPLAFGSIQEFQPDSEIVSTYLERMQLFFTANSVPQEKQVPVFLSVVGAKAYALLRSLLSPQLPHTRTYEELEDALKQHFQPKPLVIALIMSWRKAQPGPMTEAA